MGRIKKTEQELAYQLYMSGMEPPEVAERTPINYRTLLGWMKAGEWEKKREERSLGPQQVERRIRRLLDKQLAKMEADEGVSSPADWDALIKAQRAVQLSNNEASFSLKIQTVKELVQWAKVNMADEAEPVLKVTDQFVRALADNLKTGGGLI